MSGGKAKNGAEPSFLLTDDEVELLLNIAIECNAHNRCQVALTGYIVQQSTHILLPD